MKQSRKELQDELIERLQEICEDLGLVIGVPTDAAGGVIIGTEEFVATIAYAFSENDFDEVRHDPGQNKLTDSPADVRRKRNNEDPTYH